MWWHANLKSNPSGWFLQLYRKLLPFKVMFYQTVSLFIFGLLYRRSAGWESVQTNVHIIFPNQLIKLQLSDLNKPAFTSTCQTHISIPHYTLAYHTFKTTSTMRIRNSNFLLKEVCLPNYLAH